MKDKTLIYLAYEMGWISKLEVLKIINIEKYGRLKCDICKGILTNSTIDHILPKSKGGNNKLDNLRLTHSECNGIKDNKFTLKEKLKIILI
jgi:5-methylcytosine-specific restriction endonuclease McrA